MAFLLQNISEHTEATMHSEHCKSFPFSGRGIKSKSSSSAFIYLQLFVMYFLTFDLHPSAALPEGLQRNGKHNVIHLMPRWGKHIAVVVFTCACSLQTTTMGMHKLRYDLMVSPSTPCNICTYTQFTYTLRSIQISICILKCWLGVDKRSKRIGKVLKNIFIHVDKALNTQEKRQANKSEGKLTRAGHTVAVEGKTKDRTDKAKTQKTDIFSSVQY